MTLMYSLFLNTTLKENDLDLSALITGMMPWNYAPASGRTWLCLMSCCLSRRLGLAGADAHFYLPNSQDSPQFGFVQSWRHTW